MRTAKEIRQQFLNYFESKDHKIVASAPVVNQNDPTLMFINSGMAQFKDYFLGDETPVAPRIADTQKCLRVSGKHNDLEDVGKDSYHQTMFEMLGNWSFGDYFKEEAIEWAWDLLTNIFKMDKDRIYVTIFEGDESDNVPLDEEAQMIWEKYVDKERILRFGKKDNFWEMGAQGPCGPCSEIHVDIRSEAERALQDGKELVNADHPQVIEIWNLVFMQYNRKANGSLEILKNKCIDTGMGLERLCMVLQAKTSNYETDLFTPVIHKIETLTEVKYTSLYGKNTEKDTAIRVIADHARAVVTVIADGQQPSNTGAGYVVRRVLRRAVRYYFSFLDRKEPMIYELVAVIAEMFEAVFPEIKQQAAMIKKVVKGEEEAFLRTLDRGIKLFEELSISDNTIDGEDAFTLFDTYGFPFDLTCLMAEEKGYRVDKAGFKKALDVQKKRSQKDAEKEIGDWTELLAVQDVSFEGYDTAELDTKVVKYRTVKVKDKLQYQLVLEKTPFYAESGGQVGDKGTLTFAEETLQVLDTVKENNLIVHIVDKLPASPDQPLRAVIDRRNRALTEKNHSLAHLVHAALRTVLGDHVQQKGSYVSAEKMRFDFSHHAKLSAEELQKVEQIVQEKIRANISRKEERDVPIDEARASGAMMLFGEKYGEKVRIITFDDGFSKELCGGCHVAQTGQIGMFKIVSESAIAAGIRRVEALSAVAAENYVEQNFQLLQEMKELLKNSANPTKALSDLVQENKQLKKELEKMALLEAKIEVQQLSNQMEDMGAYQLLVVKTAIASKEGTKAMIQQLTAKLDSYVIVLASENEGKALLTIAVSETLAEQYELHAGKLIKQVAREIQGGGGGQALYATAGGKAPEGISKALSEAKRIITEQCS